MRRKMISLMQTRAGYLEEAEKAYQSGDMEGYRANMEKVSNMNKEIEAIKALVDEQERKFITGGPAAPSLERDKAEERGNALRKGDAITLEPLEVMKGLADLRKSITLATGTLVQPTSAGSNIRDPLGNVVSSIVDEVYVQNLSGMGGLLEPYVITETDAKGGNVTANAGKARADSDDPTFGVAKIGNYELNVTNYVDRNIVRLSPADYYVKILGMAMRAMRRKLSALIVNGDGQASPDMYGIKTAKNQAGKDIFSTVDVAGIDATLLDTLFFSYGSDDAIGPNARLYLTKTDLAAIGKLRNNDQERVFKIRPEGSNPNVGTIEDGGTIVPYTINSSLTPLSGAVASAAAVQTMLYGDPANYELGLFGDFSIRVDESIKGRERMYTILGDAIVGGNLVVHKGFVVATLPKSGGAGA